MAFLFVNAFPVSASETVVYEYDAQGRLIATQRSGTVNNGITTGITYDAAGNRTNYAGSVPPEPSFAINDVSAAEGGSLTFTITRTGSGAGGNYSVSWATANNSATAGSDYTADSGTLTFTPAQNSQTITVASIEDTAFEGSEAFHVNLSSPTGGATISDGQGVGTINDDEAAPSFAINNVSVSEGGSLTFTVTKSGSTALSHSVSWATANNSATAGSDYTAGSGTLTFTAGQTTRTITVSSIEDSVYESTENFRINLSSATGGATIADSQGTGTITDDDTPARFSINNVSVSEGGNLVFTVTKTGLASGALSVNYATANGTAGSSDYSSRSGTLTFSTAQASRTITVPTTNDTLDESNETVRVNLSSPTGGSTISDSQGIGTIIDNDEPANNPPVANPDTTESTYEGTARKNVVANDTDADGDTLTVISATSSSPGSISISGGSTINVTGISQTPMTVDYTISDGNGGADSSTLTITFPCNPPFCF